MKHWTEDDFTNWVYGLKAGDAHLEGCRECRAIAQTVLERRAAVVETPEVPSDFLAAQRRAIYSRLDQPQRSWVHARWLASALMLLIVIIASIGLLQRSSSSKAPLATPADAKLFSDLVAIEESNEPRAVQPIENLFEE